ncbi:MAG: ankyrin repeat domain-containing protein [Anaerolineae bacterium]|nr:ankyrin repeat domain-containing protein [Anaerolineae bacterium]
MASQPAEKGVWCVVANVAAEQRVGVHAEPSLGTKHFSPNTKVYCFPPQWGDGYEKIKVLGRHRGSHRLVTMVIHEKRLVNWRVQRVFHPFVVQHMGGWRSKETAELMVASILIGREAQAAAQDGLDSAAPDDALLYALRLKRPEAIQTALGRGADIRRVRDDGWSALGLAILYGGADVVHDLLRRGATASSVGRYAATAVQLTPAAYTPDVIRLVEQYTDRR